MFGGHANVRILETWHTVSREEGIDLLPLVFRRDVANIYIYMPGIYHNGGGGANILCTWSHAVPIRYVACPFPEEEGNRLLPRGVDARTVA